MAHGPLPPAPGVHKGPAALRIVDTVVGLLAILAIIVHDAAHVREGHFWNAFWICNIAAALVGPAVLLRSPALSGVALTWLLPGTAVWLLDAFVAGSRILPTSYAVHLGGTAVAVYAVRRCGRLHGVRWPVVFGSSLATLLAAFAIARWALPVQANVNAAHAVPPGWSFLGAGRTVFLCSAAALAVAVALAGAFLARAIGGAPKRCTRKSPRHARLADC